MNSLNSFHKISAAVCLIVLLGVMWSCGAALSRAAATTPSKAFGTVTEYHNPNSYILASLADGDVFTSGEKYYTELLLKPLGTPLDFTQGLVLCGDQARRLDNVKGVVAFVYKTSASGMVGGVGCHDLIGVYGVKP